MRVTLLGHASVLVEMSGATVMMDPVLADPFEEGTVVSCPRRVVDVARLPPIDIVVVSHRHPDHFDLPSLARLPRDVEVICPADPLVAYGLRQLGFARVHPVPPMAPVLGPDFELFPTRSSTSSVPELGMVFRDPSGVFWNQVDTELSDATIDSVRRHVGPVDLLFARYASQNFDFFEDRTLSFPVEEHRRNLETALRIAPRMLVPAAAGFRFCDAHAWLNAFLFPISRERYVDDLRVVAPGLDARIANPGDVFVIAGERDDAQSRRADVAHESAASAFVHTEVDDTACLAFDPTAPIPPLCDDNADGYALARLEAGVCRVFEELAAFARRDHRDPLLRAYARHRVRFLLAVVFPSGDLQWRRYGFGEEGTQVEAGRGEPPPADMVHRVTASALVSWVEHTRSFFSVRISSRRASALHVVTREEEHVDVRPLELPDVLMYYVLRAAPDAEIAGRLEVDHQLAALAATPSPP